MKTQVSLPTTPASWPGTMTATSPGPTSASAPSSIRTQSRPATTWQVWGPAGATAELATAAVLLRALDKPGDVAPAAAARRAVG